MKLKTLHVYKERTLQIAQFEPIKYGYGMEVEIEEGDKTSEVINKMNLWIDTQISNQTKLVF